ncbi:MAG: hypothetical protein C4289_14515, partial [Chloroflexota bacterium]
MTIYCTLFQFSRGPGFDRLLPLALDCQLSHPPRARLGSSVVILGHHYQRDDIIKWADFRGDSYKLSQQAASRP